MFARSADMARKKKCDASKVSKNPSIEEVCRRAGELGMTYGRYVQSPNYLIDTADDGYFIKKRKEKSK